MKWEEDELTGRWEIFKDAPNHGWVEWPGGNEPPVDRGEVDVRLRSGHLIFYRSPGSIGGRDNPGGNWVHLGERSDIIAYRRHAKSTAVEFQPPQRHETKAPSSDIPISLADPKPAPAGIVDHRCEQPDCKEWGSFGFSRGKNGDTHWFCAAHKAEGERYL